jgi:CRISPR-associated protein Csd2
MSEAIKNRYEFTVLFDVENGNPNGDPDMGNAPRIDPETGHGIVTDVCIKRKIRNFVELVKPGEARFNILIKQDDLLNNKFARAYEACGLPVPKKKADDGADGDGKDKPKSKPKKDDVAAVRAYMCANYYDVRTFGAVMSTEVSAGIVRGPVQINFARSIDPIFDQSVSITRMAITNEKDGDNTNTMGNKHIVPYALYRADGYVSAMLASDPKGGTGFDEADLELLWNAVINMFEHDRSAARGKMTVRKLFVFKHESAIGNAAAHTLFDTISVKRKADKSARAFGDYEITVETGAVPNGVELIEKA